MISPSPPPHSLEAEASLLGCAMIDNRVMSRIRELIPVEGAWYDGRHESTWQAMLKLHKAGMRVDLITLMNTLEKNWWLRFPDDSLSDFLMGLMEVVPTTHGMESYAEIVSRSANNRAQIRAYQRGIAMAAENGPLETASTFVLSELQALRPTGRGKDVLHVSELGLKYLEALEKKSPLADKRRLPTGMVEFDQRFLGLPVGLTYLSARTSEGKTTIAVSWALGFARVGPTLFVTSEVDPEDIHQRMVVIDGKIKGQIVRGVEDEPDEEEARHVSNTVLKINGLPLWILGHPEPTTAHMLSAARWVEEQERRPLVVLIFDRLEYLGLGREYAAKPLTEQTTQRSREMKRLQTELGIPVLCLVQLNQDAKRRNDDRPRLTDLQWSGAIKNDAQMVVFCYMTNYQDDNVQSGPAEIIVAKQQEGPRGPVKVWFESSLPAFLPLSNRYSNTDGGRYG